MKAKLIFDLDKPDDRREMEKAMKATEMVIIIFEMFYNGRKRAESKAEENGTDPFDEYFTMFYEMIQEYELKTILE